MHLLLTHTLRMSALRLADAALNMAGTPCGPHLAKHRSTMGAFREFAACLSMTPARSQTDPAVDPFSLGFLVAKCGFLTASLGWLNEMTVTMFILVAVSSTLFSQYLLSGTPCK